MQLSMVVALPGGLDDVLNNAGGGQIQDSATQQKLRVFAVSQGSAPTGGINLDVGGDYYMTVYPESLNQLAAVQRQFELAGPDYLASASANLTAPNGDQVSFTFVRADQGGN